MYLILKVDKLTMITFDTSTMYSCNFYSENWTWVLVARPCYLHKLGPEWLKRGSKVSREDEDSIKCHYPNTTNLSGNFHLKDWNQETEVKLMRIIEDQVDHTICT